MKPYQTPEILWQEIDFVDILTTSFATDSEVGDDSENEIMYWG